MTRRALSILGSRVGNFSAFWGIREFIWEFRTFGVPYFGVLIIRVLLFRVLHYVGSPIFGNPHI